jgi:methionyl-tRNA formyltransferase
MVGLRLVFFGTPGFAVPALRQLLASPHPVVAVVTQPDRPRGRGHHVSFSPVKEIAVSAGIPVHQPDRLKTPEFLDVLAACGADLGVVAAYGRILPDAVIATPRLGMINIHGSVLPNYRGAAPVHRAILAGETETGVSIMRVVRELDAGPVFAIARHPIGPDDTSADVERELAQLGAGLCARIVDDLAAARATEQPQDHALATYAPRLTREEGVIDWSRSSRDLHNQIRGLHPWPHAQTTLEHKRLLVLRSAPDPRPAAGLPPGSVVRASGDDLLAATGDGTLRLLALQLEGRRAMSAREFLAGHRLEPGIRLGVGAGR